MVRTAEIEYSEVFYKEGIEDDAGEIEWHGERVNEQEKHFGRFLYECLAIWGESWRKIHIETNLPPPRRGALAGAFTFSLFLVHLLMDPRKNGTFTRLCRLILGMYNKQLSVRWK